VKILGFEISRATRATASRPRSYHATHAQVRSFAAARTDRLVASWTQQDETNNQSLVRSLRTMRARSRDFARNNEYGRKFFGLVKTNVVGHAGFALKFDCRYPDGKPDTSDGDKLLRAYKRWARIGQFEVTGRLNEQMFDALAIAMIARDGEVLIRLVEGRDRGVHQFQLQLLPGHLLDELHNRDLANGNRIRMGVEFDGFMKPVAYHLRLQPINADLNGSSVQRYERVDAAEMLHLFVPEEVDQWRGAPWAFVSLRDAHQLDKFDEAALVAANVGAAKMGFFQQADGAEGTPISADPVTDGNGQDTGDLITEAAPGQFDVLPEGYTFKSYDPAYPHEVYDPFVKAVLRRLATGLGTSYHSISGDLTDVNFSSIRSGTLDEREAWKMLQGWYIAAGKERIVSAWLARALLFDEELRALPYSKFDKFNCPVFGGRRWDWVSPKDEVSAQTEAVALGIKSRAQIIRESGQDPDQVWAELKDEEAQGFKPRVAKPETPQAAAATN